MPELMSPDTAAALLRSGQRHAVVDALTDRISDPADADVAGLAVPLIQSLAALGLGAAARRMLDAAGPRLAGTVDPVTLGLDLARVPDGRVPWTAFARTGRENLKALERTRPALHAAIGDPEKRLAAVELHRDATVNLHLMRAAGPPRWLGGFADRRAERLFEVPRAESKPVTALVLGLGTGRIADRVHETSAVPAGHQARTVHLLEDDLDVFAAWLHLADRRALLLDPRTILFAGPSATEDWRAYLIERPGVGIPDHIIRTDRAIAAPGGLGDRAAAVRDEIRDDRMAAYAASLEELAAAWQGVTHAEAAARIAPGSTVVGFTSRYTTVLRYAMRDLAAAFEALGHRFILIEETADGEVIAAQEIARTLARTDAALVVVMNRLRPIDPPMFGDVPVLTLVLDPVDEVHSREGAERIGPRDVVAGFDSLRAVEELGYAEERFRPLGFFPVSPRTFHATALTAEEAGRFACDVAYVGHARGDADAWHAACLARFDPSVAPLLEAARIRLGERTRADEFITHPVAREIVAAAADDIGAAVPERLASNVAATHVHRLFDIDWRLTALEWVADWADATGRRLHLYGDGWDELRRFRPHARGPVDHDAEARLAYRGAAITLQLIPSGLVHQRSFEAMLSGSLVCGRESPSDFDFQPRAEFRAAHGDGAGWTGMLCRAGFRDLDQVVFASAAEAAATLDRWLDDDDARTIRAAHDAACVERTFTWPAVLPGLLDDVRTAIAAAD